MLRNWRLSQQNDSLDAGVSMAAIKCNFVSTFGLFSMEFTPSRTRSMFTDAWKSRHGLDQLFIEIDCC